MSALKHGLGHLGTRFLSIAERTRDIRVPHSGNIEALQGPEHPLGERIGSEELSELEILTSGGDIP